MPKISDRDKLAELVERQRKVAAEVEETRKRVRGRYAQLVPELPVEQLAERDFREVLVQALRVGGEAALAALKALPAPR
ncbi:hypothetical protein CAF53_02420 [Sphingobium sp. LB126]|uniref:hypothetical protein n=1 Tax=Sphingobium sp. LB126 TaxID=1983755 RepID=UPI000C1FE65A|nr:hypothetical protein [Sphingobium sp. LB126]PJG49637.1 hypothetical protein CAF53_02420 [Sphingobium sp. LB126]